VPTIDQSVTSLIAVRWRGLTKKIASLASQLPAGQLEWQPSADIRSYGAILRHMAFWNRFVAAKLRGESADNQANELPIGEYGTKKKAIDVFTSSANDVGVALAEAGNANVLDTVVPFLEHNAEHYGQLSMYARLLKIVPPASRT